MYIMVESAPMCQVIDEVDKSSDYFGHSNGNEFVEGRKRIQQNSNSKAERENQ